MAEKKAPTEPKRLNRIVGAGEALGRALDPAFKKRGFASRDLLRNWGAIAPKPYDTAAQPDRLVWPRGVRTAEGATLYLKAAPGHALALAHEADAVAAAINRYFGYLLVGAVKLSPMPLLLSTSAPAPEPEPPETAAAVQSAVSDVADDGLRAALERLGRGISRQNGKLTVR